AQLTVDVEDPARCRWRVAEPLDRAGRSDAPLQALVLAPQLRVVAQGVAEGDVAGVVAALRLDVEVDPVQLPAELERADGHRARRRPRVGAGLRPEAQVVEHLD